MFMKELFKASISATRLSRFSPARATPYSTLIPTPSISSTLPQLSVIPKFKTAIKGNKFNSGEGNRGERNYFLFPTLSLLAWGAYHLLNKDNKVQCYEVDRQLKRRDKGFMELFTDSLMNDLEQFSLNGGIWLRLGITFKLFIISFYNGLVLALFGGGIVTLMALFKVQNPFLYAFLFPLISYLYTSYIYSFFGRSIHNVKEQSKI